MSDLLIRPYAPADIAAVAEIYAHYVRETVITFETEPTRYTVSAVAATPRAGSAYP